MESAVPLLLAALIVVGLIGRWVYARRNNPRQSEAGPAPADQRRAPLWYREFLKHDFLDPAFHACTLRLKPAPDQRWHMGVILRSAGGTTVRQVADLVDGQELARMDKALARIGWTLAGRAGGLEDCLSLSYVRRPDAPRRAPPEPDSGFDTAWLKAAQNGSRLTGAQIRTLPVGDGWWQVSVGFHAAHTSGWANFDDPVTIPQIFKIIADLSREGWQETQRVYYATRPGTTDYSGAIAFMLSRK